MMEASLPKAEMVRYAPSQLERIYAALERMERFVRLSKAPWPDDTPSISACKRLLNKAYNIAPNAHKSEFMLTSLPNRDIYHLGEMLMKAFNCSIEQSSSTSEALALFLDQQLQELSDSADAFLPLPDKVRAFGAAVKREMRQALALPACTPDVIKQAIAISESLNEIFTKNELPTLPVAPLYQLQNAFEERLKEKLSVRDQAAMLKLLTQLQEQTQASIAALPEPTNHTYQLWRSTANAGDKAYGNVMRQIEQLAQAGARER